MAQETNQSQAPLLCSTGCGFYGNPRTDGMCSICYKDFLQRQKTNVRVTETVSVPAVSSSLSSLDESLSAPSSVVTPAAVTQEEGASAQAESQTEDVTDASAQSAAPEPNNTKPKKNRCFTCNKKVGLLGFGCHCGNVFCGVHRYSDVHKCSFDYKTDAAEKIRKDNPVIIGEKISKI